MVKDWESAIITDVSIAVYVPFGAGHQVHTSRPFHGFVMNDLSGAEKDYHFSDGQILKTKAGDVFYLPKGSTYRVETIGTAGGCWAINFDLLMPLQDEPFAITVKNPAAILEIFKEATDAFRHGRADRELTTRRNLYSIILKLLKELQKGYVPSSKMKLIQPALDAINSGFTDHELTVHALAKLCGISVAYFRRIFVECTGMPPQEHIIERRLHYAKQLLKDGQFSVSEVAEMCGYTEPCHFSRGFSARVGMTPREFAAHAKKDM